MKLVKDDTFIKAVDELVQEDLEVLDEVIQEDIEVLQIVANPEKLIGKPYELWTPQDMQMLVQIYGDSDKIQKLIFNKEYEHYKEMEAILDA
jgi:hypothetical protein